MHIRIFKQELVQCEIFSKLIFIALWEQNNIEQNVEKRQMTVIH